MIIVGLDEVGRGCWAGPLVAAAVVLGRPIAGLADSKVLTRVQREMLATQIKAEALSYGLGWIAPAFIDMYGLTLSVQRAMQQALAAITVPFEQIIIDGNYNFLPNEPLATFLIKADATVPAVSAASILAKVARDDFMTMAAKGFPDYGFERHVGYGTAAHLAALKTHGITELHRKSFKPVRVMLELAAVEHAKLVKQAGNHVVD